MCRIQTPHPQRVEDQRRALPLRSSIKVIDVQEQFSDLGSDSDVSCSNNQGSGEFFLELDDWNNTCYKDVADIYRLDRNCPIYSLDILDKEK